MSDWSPAKKKKSGKRERPLARPLKQPQSEEQLEELTPEEYQEQKTLILTRAALAEKEYIKLRTTLKETKMREAEEYKIMVENGECPEFVAAKKEAEELRDQKQNINEATRDMRMAQIADEFEAEMSMNRTQFDDHYEYSKQRFIEYYKELIAEKTRRDDEMTQVMAALLRVKPTLNLPVYGPAALTKVVNNNQNT